MRYVLRRRDPNGYIEEIPLTDRLVIGRDNADVRIAGDRFASGRHAEVQIAGEQVILRDLDSRNGTFVRLDGEIELRNGDVLLVGRQLLRYLE